MCFIVLDKKFSNLAFIKNQGSDYTPEWAESLENHFISELKYNGLVDTDQKDPARTFSI